MLAAAVSNTGKNALAKPSPARIDLKVNEDVKSVLVKAALIDGVDMKSFVLGVALEKARRVIAEHEVVMLSRQGQQRLLDAIKAPSKPTSGMLQLMSLPDFATE